MAMAYSGGFNLANLKQSLYRHRDNIDQAIVHAVDEGAEIIMEEAKKNVPVDTYNLEDAIHVSKRETRNHNHAIDIEVSGTGRDARDVATYAMVIHEMYDYYISIGHWHMGEESQAKQAANPNNHVGSKFLERAVEAKKKEVIDNIRKAIRATR